MKVSANIKGSFLDRPKGTPVVSPRLSRLSEGHVLFVRTKNGVGATNTWLVTQHPEGFAVKGTGRAFLQPEVCTFDGVVSGDVINLNDHIATGWRMCFSRKRDGAKFTTSPVCDFSLRLAESTAHSLRRLADRNFTRRSKITRSR